MCFVHRIHLVPCDPDRKAGLVHYMGVYALWREKSIQKRVGQDACYDSTGPLESYAVCRGTSAGVLPCGRDPGASMPSILSSSEEQLPIKYEAGQTKYVAE
ncbi:hypothetical protein V2G26_020844 [Clonostachys chloroleuca]